MLGMAFRFRETFNLQLVCSIMVICISQVNYGFESLGYGVILAIDQFRKQFGVLDPKTNKYDFPTWWLSLFNSCGYLGLFVGVLIGSIVSKRFGRRWCMFSMSIWALVTATLSVTASTSSQILVARVLNCKWLILKLNDENESSSTNLRSLHWHVTFSRAHLPV